MSRDNPSHPGESVRDNVEEMGWSISEFAARIGVSRNTASRLLNGRCGVSPKVALALERLGWSDADFWMRYQAHYDLAQARRKLTATTASSR